MTQIQLALQLMMYGLVGVFTVIFLFMLVTQLLLKIFPYKEDKENS